MRTRRSPRNQDRLWKLLCGPAKAKTVPTAPKTDDEIDAMFWVPKHQRERMKRDAMMIAKGGASKLRK